MKAVKSVAFENQISSPPNTWLPFFLPTHNKAAVPGTPGTLASHSHSPSLAFVCMSETHKLRACFEIRPWFKSRLPGLIDLDDQGKLTLSKSEVLQLLN